MRKSIGILLCLLMFDLFVNAEDIKEEKRTVSVTGTATAVAPYDAVLWRLSLVVYNDKLAEAQKQLDEKFRAVMKLCGDFRIAKEDINVGVIEIEDYFIQKRTSNETSARFKVSRELKLLQKDSGSFGYFTEKLRSAPIKESEYKIIASTLNDVVSETRLLAVKAAQDKAGAMAELLGEKISRVLSISEYPSVDFAGSPEDLYVDVQRDSVLAKGKDVKQSVYVVFELE